MWCPTKKVAGHQWTLDRFTTAAQNLRCSHGRFPQCNRTTGGPANKWLSPDATGTMKNVNGVAAHITEVPAMHQS